MLPEGRNRSPSVSTYVTLTTLRSLINAFNSQNPLDYSATTLTAPGEGPRETVASYRRARGPGTHVARTDTEFAGRNHADPAQGPHVPGVGARPVGGDRRRLRRLRQRRHRPRRRPPPGAPRPPRR